MLREIITTVNCNADLQILELLRQHNLNTGGFFQDNLRQDLQQRAGNIGVLQHSNPQMVFQDQIRTTDATIIFTLSPQTEEEFGRLSALINQMVLANKPYFLVTIDPDAENVDEDVVNQCATWISTHHPRVVNLKMTRRRYAIKNFLSRLLVQNPALVGNQADAYEPWHQRWERYHQSRDIFSRFLYQPTQESREPLKRWIWALILDTYQRAQGQPNPDLWNIEELTHLQICTTTFYYLDNRLGMVLNGEISSLLSFCESYRSLDGNEDLSYYVTAVTHFHFWKNAENDVDKTRFAKLLRSTLTPHLERYGRVRRWDDLVVQQAINYFLDENAAYIQGLANLDFITLLRRFEGRFHYRLTNAYRNPDNQLQNFEDYQVANNLDHDDNQVRNIQGLRQDVRGEMEGILEQEREFANQISDALFRTALGVAQSVQYFPRNGRRLFLTMILGGLSHRSTCALRGNSETTNYLVQPPLIQYLLEENPNFFRQWFVNHLNIPEIKNRFIQAYNTAWNNVQDNELLEIDHNFNPAGNDIAVQKIFIQISNYAAEAIQQGHYAPQVIELAPEDWFGDIINQLGQIPAENFAAENLENFRHSLVNLTKTVLSQENWWCNEQLAWV